MTDKIYPDTIYRVIAWTWDEEFEEYFPDVAFENEDKDEALKFFNSLKPTYNYPQVEVMEYSEGKVTTIAQNELSSN